MSGETECCMSDCWQRVPIGELCEGVYDGPHATPPKTDRGTVFLGIWNLVDGRVDLSETEHIAPEHHERWSRRVKPRAGDLVFSYETRLGAGATIPPELDCVLGRRMALARPDPAKVNPRFLLYAFLSPEFQATIRKHTVPGSTVDRIPLLEFPKFPVVLPLRPSQDAIAAVLGSLDDKIEHNRKTARALEQLARAIFRAWFVDFEPVKAKAAGAMSFPSMPQDVFDALPTTFTDSEIGPVPEGWGIVDVYALAEVIYGAPFKSKLFNDEGKGKRLIRIRDLQTHLPNVFTPEEHPKGTLIKPGDIVVGMDGEFRLHYWAGPEAWLNQRLCSFSPLRHVPPMFLGESLRMPLDFVERSEAATTVIHLGKYDIDRFELLRPDDRMLEAFGVITTPILAAMVHSTAESRKLAELRDYLLPKLLSGQVSVGNIEKGEANGSA